MGLFRHPLWWYLKRLKYQPTNFNKENKMHLKPLPATCQLPCFSLNMFYRALCWCMWGLLCTYLLTPKPYLLRAIFTLSTDRYCRLFMRPSRALLLCFIGLNMMTSSKWKHFPRYWPVVRGIHRSRWIPHTKASDAEFWCFLWSASE